MILVSILLCVPTSQSTYKNNNMNNMNCFIFLEQTKLDLDFDKETRLQVEETLASLREESGAKDKKLEVPKVQIEALEQSMDTLHKIHQDYQDQNFLGMMDNILEKNNKIEDLFDEKGHLQAQLVALEE